MSYTQLTLPPRLEQLLHRRLAGTSSTELANGVLKLSSFFNENVGSSTPWHEPYAQNAYLAYFTPLNWIRLKAAFQEVNRFLPRDCVSQIWDIGSGSGTTQWVLEDESNWLPRPFYCVETSAPAQKLHQALASDFKGAWQPVFQRGIEPAPGALGVFSYSYLETKMPLEVLQKFDHLLLLEPSLRDVSRALMQQRKTLIDAGFNVLAPCTHTGQCPLLKHSQKDWCHQRVHFSGPEWFQEIEQHLPMKNRTLTYSYLLLSRTQSDTKWRGQARAIGDTQIENGKTKQMICRNESREFLSWLHKLGEVPQIPHGSLIAGVDVAEVKGSELRPQPGSLTWV